jgi:hypothetical protein
MPETKARKWPLEATWPLAETKHQHASPPIRRLFAKSREISVRVRLRGGAGRSPTLGEINGLQMVRVEITPLNAKEDFAATRTLRLDVERRITPRSEPPLMEAKSTDPAAHIRNERATFMLPLAPSALRGFVQD